MRSCNRLEWVKSRFQLFKILTIGLTSSLQKAKRTCLHSASTQIGEGPSWLPKRTHTMTHSLDGSLLTSRLITKSPMLNVLQSILNWTVNPAQTMIVRKVKVLVPKSTLVSKFNLLTFQKYLPSGLKKKFTLLQQLLDQKLCSVRRIVISFLRANTACTKWRTMSSSSWVNVLLATWLSKN
jgi:hypothetical protein